MSGITVANQLLDAPEGITVLSYRSSDLPHFRLKKRERAVTQIHIQETWTSSVRSALSLFEREPKGTHFIVGSEGIVYQHADLLEDECNLGTHYDDSAIGIAVVNPFVHRYVPMLGPWLRKIDVPWTDQPYYLPTQDQCESVVALIRWCISYLSTLSIPLAWPSVKNGALAMGRYTIVDPEPGIHARRHFSSHEDGSWLILYSWLRIESGLSPEAAYEEAAKLAVNQISVDIEPYLHTQ